MEKQLEVSSVKKGIEKCFQHLQPMAELYKIKFYD